MSTATAPMEIGRIRLVVRDLSRVADFYARALGLEKLSSDGGGVALGAGDRVLVELQGDPAARIRSPREAGLFHTAFLLPARADLGAWVHHASETRLPVQGASDHLVSEAIYFADPEGNGIEIYADRPRSGWTHPDGSIRMATDPLDIPDLAAAARAPWRGAPQGTVVGHVHLQVGNVAEAEAFYAGTLGFAVTAHYPGAAFFGAGGYHHHIGSNVWNSRGAGRREGGTGLASVELLAEGGALDRIAARTGGATRIADPWGTDIVLTRKAA
ncbi:MAG: hypothetical protein RIR62_1712 [Pseudomonadota bacterium]|jgi:catechol 2,3-dioxygenase